MTRSYRISQTFLPFSHQFDIPAEELFLLGPNPRPMHMRHWRIEKKDDARASPTMHMAFLVGFLTYLSKLILISPGEQGTTTKRSASKLEKYESQMGTVNPRQSSNASAHVQTGLISSGVYEIANGATSTEDEEQMFSMIKKPRVRYDVEVVTRLIVYMGKIHSSLRRLK